MNKMLLATTLVMGLTALNAQAADMAKRGGFVGPSINISTVEDVKSMRDDTKVTLQGNIERHLGGEDYLFKDKTGSIKVEIDDEDWKGLEVTPNDQIEIRGEVDKGWNSIEVDVDSVTKINK